MARPLRVDVEGGWYHITSRGIERRTIFEDARDHGHFLDLLEEMSDRYGVEIHAYVMLGNHYHLLIRAPQANASKAIQWLNVSYSVWFNKRRERVGHVFQGRFTSALIDGDGAWALSASVYVHLNPIRTKRFGLGKKANRVEARGLKAPNREEIKKRLRELRTFRWSSFPAYAGYRLAPPWLQTTELTRRAGGKKRYRRRVQEHATRGSAPEGFEDWQGRLALGSVEFQSKIKEWVGKVTGEHLGRQQLAPAPVSLARVVEVVEKQRGASWEQFSQRHGDWGRELVLYLARQRSGLTLRQIGAGLGGMEYKAASHAIRRFAASLPDDATRRSAVSACLTELAIGET